MKISSMLKKGYLMSWLRFKLRRFLVDGNLYYVGAKLQHPKKCLFYFPFYEFMHFGDHLFFEPLMHFMQQSNIQVVVCPIKPMEFYFEHLGYTTKSIDEINPKDFDLVISRIELYPEVKRFANLLMIKIAYHEIEVPLSQDMVNKVAKLINKPSMVMPAYAKYVASKKNMDILQTKHQLNLNQNYIVVNTYVDSGSYSVLKKHKEYILQYVTNYLKNNNCQIILTGSENDKKTDTLQYNFDCLDLRGKTTIPELFTLMQLPMITAYIGFDGLLMHLTNMYNKPSYVVVRKSTEIYWGGDIGKFVVPFITPSPQVTIIND